MSNPPIKKHAFQNKKIAIFHDSFFIKWWAERMNILMANILNADLVSSVFKKESFSLKQSGFQWKSFEIHPKFTRWILWFLKMKWAFLQKTNFLNRYDIVIFSNEAISAVSMVHSPKKIYYAHSISRHLFDQKEQYLKKISLFIRPLARIGLSVLKKLYIRNINSVNLILTNSQKNKQFLQSLAPNISVEILYPPVDTTEFTPSKWGDHGYFLSYARLTHAKRIDRIIEVFKELPNEKIKIIYGKTIHKKMNL